MGLGLRLGLRLGLMALIGLGLTPWPGQAQTRDAPSSAAKVGDTAPAAKQVSPSKPSKPSKPLKPYRFAFGPWMGRAIFHGPSGRFLRCQAESGFAQRVSLRFVMGRGRDVTLEFSRAYWMLQPGESFQSGILPNGGPLAHALSSRRVAVTFGNAVGGLSRLMAQDWLSVFLPDGEYDFFVPEGRRLLSSLERCVTHSLKQEEQRRQLLETKAPEKRRHWCAPPRLDLLLSGTDPATEGAAEETRPAPPPETVDGAEDKTEVTTEGAPPQLPVPAGAPTPPIASPDSAAASPTATGPAATGPPAASHESARTRMARLMLHRAGVVGLSLLPDNIREAQFPAAEIAWLANHTYGFLVSEPGPRGRLEALTAETLSPKAFDCRGTFEAKLHEDATGILGRLKRLLVSCDEPKDKKTGKGRGVTYFLAFFERTNSLSLITHCAEHSHLEEAFLADESVSQLLTEAIVGWQP